MGGGGGDFCRDSIGFRMLASGWSKDVLGFLQESGHSKVIGSGALIP